MILPLQGGCLCGKIRYRIDAPALSASVCHCLSCRRAAGAASVAWATFPAAAFAFAGAEPARYASSPGVTRTHCAACGTSLTFQRCADGNPEAAPGTAARSIDVTLASLDDPEALIPTEECWLAHRLAWQAVDPTRTAFAEGSD